MIYRPILLAASEFGPPGLKFLKEINHQLPQIPVDPSYGAGNTNQQRPRPLRVLSHIAGLSAVFMPGASPSLVVRTLKSLPHIVELQDSSVRGLSEFKSSGTATSFVYIDRHVCLP